MGPTPAERESERENEKGNTEEKKEEGSTRSALACWPLCLSSYLSVSFRFRPPITKKKPQTTEWLSLLFPSSSGKRPADVFFSVALRAARYLFFFFFFFLFVFSSRCTRPRNKRTTFATFDGTMAGAESVHVSSPPQSTSSTLSEWPPTVKRAITRDNVDRKEKYRVPKTLQAAPLVLVPVRNRIDFRRLFS